MMWCTTEPPTLILPSKYIHYLHNRTLFYLILRDQSAFHCFVSGIVANGGGDGPEDIMGGLTVALSSLCWRPGSSRVRKRTLSAITG